MSFGLVLGGGGVVGIAWEVGVLAGLQRAGALDPAAADVIVGTSAGSVVGTRLALGHTLDDLILQLEREQRASASSASPAAGPAPDMRVVMEIFTALYSVEKVTAEVAKVAGAKAMAAATPPEDRWIAGFDATLGGAGASWPSDRDLRVTAVDCHTGERRVWTRADADVVPLATAVASSCAVPGMFPTVAIDGRRYTDGGVWSGTNADVLVDDGLDAVLLVTPTAAGPGDAIRRPAHEAEAELLEAAGVRTSVIRPGATFAREIGPLNLMNPAMRARGLQIGLDDGAAAADTVRKLRSTHAPSGRG